MKTRSSCSSSASPVTTPTEPLKSFLTYLRGSSAPSACLYSVVNRQAVDEPARDGGCRVAAVVDKEGIGDQRPAHHRTAGEWRHDADRRREHEVVPPPPAVEPIEQIVARPRGVHVFCRGDGPGVAKLLAGVRGEESA